MYIFGLDIPIAEIFFILILLMIALAIFLIFVMYKIGQVNKKMDVMVKKEGKELKQFTDMNVEEKKELSALRTMKKELDRLVKDEEKERKILKKIIENRQRYFD